MNLDQGPDYDGPERRRAPHLTDAQLDDIAERAATRAVKKMTDDAYKAVGKSVLDKLLWLIGLLVVAGYLWAQSKGLVKP